VFRVWNATEHHQFILGPPGNVCVFLFVCMCIVCIFACVFVCVCVCQYVGCIGHSLLAIFLTLCLFIGSGAPFHFHCDAINFLAYGRKK